MALFTDALLKEIRIPLIYVGDDRVYYLLNSKDPLTTKKESNYNTLYFLNIDCLYYMPCYPNYFVGSSISISHRENNIDDCYLIIFPKIRNTIICIYVMF